MSPPRGEGRLAAFLCLQTTLYLGHQEVPLPTLEEGLLSIYPSWKCPHEPTQRTVFYLTLEAIRLGIKIASQLLCLVKSSNHILRAPVKAFLCSNWYSLFILSKGGIFSPIWSDLGWPMERA